MTGVVVVAIVMHELESVELNKALCAGIGARI